MADQFDSNTRSPQPESEIDDPLAELARIIGYERPSEVAPAGETAQVPAEFDLEAELMRELDVPLAPSDDELDSVEADEAVDAMLAESDFDDRHELDEELTQAFSEQKPTGSSAEDEYQREQEVSDEPVSASANDDAASSQDARFESGDGRSSEALLAAIENESRYDRHAGHPADETGIDDDWMRTLDADDDAPMSETDGPETGEADSQQPDAGSKDAAQAPVAAVAETSVTDDPVDDDVFNDMARFELPSAAQRDRTSGALPGDDQSAAPVSARTEPAESVEADASPMDFEEYLSTELDVFGHEIAIGQPGESPVTHEQDADDIEAQLDVETALDALNDSTLDDDVAVFDEAAEELLAAINEDGDTNVNDGESEAQREPEASASTEAEDPWSLDSIEEATTEELDEELGDMFGLPDRVVTASDETADVSDELDFDLEQVLAESFADEAAQPTEQVETVETRLQTGKPVQADDWLSIRPEPEETSHRDEISEAFLDLAPEKSVGPEAKSVPDRAPGEPEQTDWLEGFETSEQGLEPGGADSDDSEYYFDAGLISEADETVELVSDIEVPELQHDEPQPIDPEYETEIEREFADIVERPESHQEEAAVLGAGAAFAATDGWNRAGAVPHADEVSDEYIALERELGVISDERGRPSVVEGADASYPAAGYDFDETIPVAPSAENSRSRGPVLAFAVLGVALFAGVGAFAWSMLSDDDTTADGGPRIIRADKEPVKILPENPGGMTVPNQDKAVYDRVAGGAGKSSGQPALVNSAEEPVDVVQRTLDPEILPLEGRSEFSEKSEERLTADATSDEAPPEAAAGPVVSPRKVRTMIVKPDGSIVAREVSEPETDASAAPAETPDVAQSPPEGQAQPLLSPAPVEQVDAAEVAPPVEDEPANTEAAASEGTVAPVRVVTTQQIRPVANAPVPQGRPADQPVNVVGTVTQGGTVNAAPAVTATPQPVEVASAPAAAAPAAAPVANPGGYYVQIASQPTVEGARSSWQTLSNRYSSVLGGQSVDIQRADIPGKGVFHRVRVPAGNRDQANALCSRYKAAGGSCFVSR
ncbi:sporulation related protein [Hoeflea halophila]|uniref:Sporulation related protein n=1 Tax=Hoeflea halophila TaxID=714899 RepID=A0A286HL00_9HYPH|nr:SPOR domain-containing protein [Hoeflea halophila]SOE08397.1 sporulation related protein [Hoeflea halophila]